MSSGPNRVFLRYIERVLPSLGEAGVEQVVLADLVPNVRIAGAADVVAESQATRRIKGDARMSTLIDRAVGDRERPLRDDLVVPFRAGFLRLTVEESARIVKAASRRFHRHNTGRRHVEGEFFAALAASSRSGDVSGGELRQELRGVPEVRAALERMWPVLTPAQLLHDLFGSRALLRLAARNVFDEAEIEALYRPRSDDVADVRWAASDVALLDDARDVLGPVPNRSGRINDADEIRTYGHIVVDEVQDLSPMQLKMVARRSLNGSLTVVGDLAQATGPWAPSSWSDVTDHLPDRRPSRVTGLSVGYRIPAQIMQLADGVMHAATPGLRAPRSVRDGDAVPEIVPVASPAHLGDAVAAATTALTSERSGMSVVVVVPDEMAGEISTALDAAGIAHGRAAATGLDAQVTVVPISLAKGLEVDGVVVVEPARIVASEIQGLRALYVALDPPHPAPDDRPRRTTPGPAGRRRRCTRRRRAHPRLKGGGEDDEVGVGLVGVGGTTAIDAAVQQGDRPIEVHQDVGRGVRHVRAGSGPDRVDAPDGLALALVGDDRLAQHAGLGEQLVEQLAIDPTATNSVVGGGSSDRSTGMSGSTSVEQPPTIVTARSAAATAADRRRHLTH